jgi:hypothetical protein
LGAAEVWAGSQIVDIHDPSAPILKWSSSNGAFPVGISLVRTTAYVGGIRGKDPQTASFEILDVQDVSAPKSLGVLPLPDGVRASDIAVANGVAYFRHRYALFIVDVRDSTTPRLLAVYGHLPEQETEEDCERSFIYGMAVEGPLVYLAQGGIRILDVSDLRSPKEVGFFRIRGWARGISVYNGIVYVTVFHTLPWPGNVRKRYSAELVVVNATNPSKPVRLGKMKISKSIDDFALSNGVVYAWDYDNLYVHNLNDMELPPIAAQSTVPSKNIDNGRLVTECKGGFKIFDISELLSPKLVGTYQIKQ